MIEETDYSIFFEFIKNYSGNGFTRINNSDHFMVRLNRLLNKRQQFFYIADLIDFKLIYCSPQVFDIFGIAPEKFDLSFIFRNTHPLEIRKRSRVRAKVIETGQELFINKTGYVLNSSTFTMKNVNGKYVPMLFQRYTFYSSSPIDTVYFLMITTPLDLFAKIFKKGHYHWYEGIDLKYFRYPDEDLLLAGSNLSERELEVIMYVHKGLESKEIGEKLFLSPYTISSHRRNILKKSGKSSIGELIYELEVIGMI
jgi:DNA-binding CsgD family transcriptional regulator